MASYEYPSCTGVRLTFSEAKTEKKDMQELNNKLAYFIQWVGELKSASSVGGDMSSYHEAMKQLEGELVKLKAMYEGELEKLRAMLYQANSEKNQLSLEAQKMTASHGKLTQEANKVGMLEASLLKLQAALADREKELAEIRALLRQKEQEANCASKYMAECENLRLKLAEETKLRQGFEAKLKDLTAKYSFEVQVHGNQQKDLQERVKAANEIILALEAKMKSLNNMGGNLPAALQKLREGTVAEMQKYQQETEHALNKNLEAIRLQLDFSAKAKDSLEQEKLQLQMELRELSARLVEFEAQNKALLAENKALKADIDGERSRAQLTIKELEAKLTQLQNKLLCHGKEFMHAREAQASLRTEIEAYRALLDAESGKLGSKGQGWSASTTVMTTSGSNLPSIGRSASMTSQSGKVSANGDRCGSGQNDSGFKASFELSGKGSGSCGASLGFDKNASFSWKGSTKSSPNGYNGTGGYRGTTNHYQTTYKVNYSPSGTQARSTYFSH